MKNIFLTLALLLTVSFAFAGNNNVEKILLKTDSNTKIIETTSIQNTKIINVELSKIDKGLSELKNLKEDDNWVCVNVFVNGKWAAVVCGETTGEILNKIIFLFL